MAGILGRYTAIMTTTVIFLVLVLSVLALNFYSSFETEKTAEAVNIAGRQRMLSQKTAKSLLSLQTKIKSDQSFSPVLSELKSASSTFNQSLNAFFAGGATLSTKGGETILEQVTEADGAAILNPARELWLPFYDSLQEMIQGLEAKPESVNSSNTISLIDQNVAYADKHINTLLKLMNDLTNYQENIAAIAADRSRLVQGLGILASLVCFAIIMFLIFGQLRTSDRRAAGARRETQQIFETVDQGLFLISKNFKVGSQQSRELKRIFLKAPEPGQDFTKFVASMVSPRDLDNVKRFLKLLFDPRKKQALLSDLNPLNQLPIQIERSGEIINKTLRFSFSRVVDAGEISGVLSSVTDISHEIKLAEDLAAETKRNEQQLSMISVLLNANPESLPEFLQRSDKTYDQINAVLRNQAVESQDLNQKANVMLTLIHGVKGDSAALGLNLISDACHEFENQVDALTKKNNVTGNDFLSLTVILDQLISVNEQIKSVINALQMPKHKTGLTKAQESLSDKLFEFGEHIALRQNKEVTLSIAGIENAGSDLTSDIHSIVTQLIRNAICHGIELPDTRKLGGKKSMGQVSVALFRNSLGEIQLTCSDDGSGVDFKKLAAKACATGLIEDATDHDVCQKQLLKLMMTNRLSSTENMDTDSGRGVGLNVVSEIAKKLNAKVFLHTRSGQGSKFTIRIPSSISAENQLGVQHA